jgi:hypothetical protein
LRRQEQRTFVVRAIEKPTPLVGDEGFDIAYSDVSINARLRVSTGHSAAARSAIRDAAKASPGD